MNKEGGGIVIFYILIFIIILGNVGNIIADPTIIGTPSSMNISAVNSSGTRVTYPLPTATDSADITDPVVCIPVSGSIFPIRTTFVTCTSQDSNNEINTTKFYVNVTAPTTPPIISGVPTISQQATSPSGAVTIYSLPNATDVFGNHAAVSCNPLSGSLFPIGTTGVNCTATDVYGNKATTLLYVVVEAPKNLPKISRVPATITKQAASSSGISVVYPSPTAIDLYGNSVGVSCNPPSSSIFHIGATNVNCIAIDSYGNEVTSSFDVIITVPRILPTIIGTPSDITQTATNSSGNVIIYTNPTATNEFGASIPISCSPKSGSLFPIGTSEVTCMTEDSYGNIAISHFSIIIETKLAEILEFSGIVIVLVSIVIIIVSKKRKSK